MDTVTPESVFQNYCCDDRPEAQRWVVAYSGGVDSHVLLYVLAHTQHVHKMPIHALHINHNLSEHAEAWQQHCVVVCQQLNIPFTAISVTLDRQSGQGLEAAARDARYQAFESFLQTGDLLWLAQHADDQIETFFLRLLRGAGAHGLSAMPSSRALAAAHLYRPFLSVMKQDVLRYANTWQLQWVDDDSNADTRFDRNFLRQTLLPALAQRWPEYRQNVGRSIRLLQQSSVFQQNFFRLELQRLTEHSIRFELPVPELLKYDRYMQGELLRLWLSDQGCCLPSERVLQQGLRLLSCRQDAQPQVRWGRFELRRFQEKLYLLRDRKYSEFISQDWTDKSQVCQLKDQRVIRIEKLASSPENMCLAISYLEHEWSIRFRSGGEIAQPATRRHKQKLKKILQEYHVPPWERERLPLLFIDDQLAAVVGLFICEGFTAQAGDEGVSLIIDEL